MIGINKYCCRLRKLFPYAAGTQMCITNLPTFAFSILPITVVPECLTHYIFAFKKRKYTRQNMHPQRFKDLSVYFHWH